MTDLIERLRKITESGVVVDIGLLHEAADEIERLRSIAIAARDLVENIRDNGIHDNWKQTATALDEVNLDGIEK